MEGPVTDLRPIEIADERSPLAREAVRLIRESIGDVQPTADLLSEVEERRRGLPSGGAVPFDLGYFHPWLPRGAEGRYVLYREPIDDPRTELPSSEVIRLLYAIWRRAYRVDFPLQSDTFCYMLDQLEGRAQIGAAGDLELPGR
jgi:hypothetical protein